MLIDILKQPRTTHVRIHLDYDIYIYCRVNCSRKFWILLCSFPRFEISLFQVLLEVNKARILTRLHWCLSICLFYFSEGSGWLGQEGGFPGISEWMRTPLCYCRRSLRGIFNGISRPRITHSYIKGEPHFVSVAADSPILRVLPRKTR